MMILGLNISMYCSKTNGQSDSSKIQCYYCSSVTCHVVVPAKAKHDGRMDGRTDDGQNDPFLVTHDNNIDNTFDPDRYCLTKS